MQLMQTEWKEVEPDFRLAKTQKSDDGSSCLQALHCLQSSEETSSGSSSGNKDSCNGQTLNKSATASSESDILTASIRIRSASRAISSEIANK